jgi:hypothetical protein
MVPHTAGTNSTTKMTRKEFEEVFAATAAVSPKNSSDLGG